MVDMDSRRVVEGDQYTASPTLTNHFLESLFFSMSVYEPTQEALLNDLEKRFGRVQPLMSYGFDSNASSKGQRQVIFVARSHSGRVIVTCRGTSGFHDVLQDLKYMQCRLSFAKGTAHWGFAERAESVPIDFFLKLLDAGEEIIFTGHSMGGAVASLLTLRLLESKSNSKRMYDEQLRCITFGTPLFASNRLAEMINDKYKDIFIHIVSRRDVVPKILPWISTLQKLVYAGEDHLEGLMVLKSALSFVPWIPIAPLLTAVEMKIPPLLKLLLRFVMKLALPSGMAAGSYAFAGHIVMLDTVAGVKVDHKKKKDNNSLILTSAEDLNSWHSQLNFAFGCGFDVTMIEEHMLNCYHDGIVRAFSQVRLTRELTMSSAAGELDPSFTAELENGTENSEINHSSDGRIVVRMIPQEGCCEMELKSFSSSSFLSREVNSSSTATLIRAKSLASLNKTLSSAGESSFMKSQWRRRLERSYTTMGSTTLSSCKHGRTRWSVPENQRQQQQGRSSNRSQKERRCRACQCLRLYMDVKGSCRHVTKSFFNLGWILGTVGRVASHLKLLDNLCALTFFRLVLGSIVA